MKRAPKPRRTHNVNAYFTDEEVAIIDAMAERQGYSRSGLVRFIVKETVRTAIAAELAAEVTS